MQPSKQKKVSVTGYITTTIERAPSVFGDFNVCAQNRNFSFPLIFKLEVGENLAVAPRQIAPYEIKVILHISAECTGVVFLYLKKYIVRPKIIDAAGIFITELKLCDFPVTAPNPNFKCLKILVSNIQT